MNMINTILFDLDGTLLHLSQKAFVDAYFTELKKALVKLGLDAEAAAKAVWAGTKAMVAGSDGQSFNTERFWKTFAAAMGLDGEKLSAVEAACDSFYINEFDSIKSIVKHSDISKRLVHGMAAKGYSVVLATNPLFPLCAVTTRLGWIGLKPSDFLLVTHYTNSKYCKPNPEYYREIFAKINKTPQQCLIAGNNPAEDMCAGALGAHTYLVTDCLENEIGMDITAFRQGSLAELETYLLSLPDIRPA